MRWEELLSAKRCRGGQTRGRNAKSSDLRSEFEKDYHRIIGSASFRRLQDKTQVFPLDKSDFIRTRLTHSLEVSSFAKSLGQNIGENILVYKKDSEFTPQMKEDICNILQCAGLIHDIGNPPLGIWRRCDPGVVRTEAAIYDISWKADGTSDEPADGRGSVSF